MLSERNNTKKIYIWLVKKREMSTSMTASKGAFLGFSFF